MGKLTVNKKSEQGMALKVAAAQLVEQIIPKEFFAEYWAQIVVYAKLDRASVIREEHVVRVVQTHLRTSILNLVKGGPWNNCTHGEGFCYVHCGKCPVHYYHEPDGRCECQPCPKKSVHPGDGKFCLDPD